MKKLSPVAVCSKCDHYTFNSSLINQRCPRKFRKSGRCKGIYVSRLTEGDWEECFDCSGKNEKCEICQGTGWINKR